MPDIDQIKRALQACGGNKTEAGKQIGMSRHAIKRALAKESARFDVIGKSTLIDRRTDEPILEWVKTSADMKQREEAAQAVFDALQEKLPRFKPVKAPQHTAWPLLMPTQQKADGSAGEIPR